MILNMSFSYCVLVFSLNNIGFYTIPFKYSDQVAIGISVFIVAVKGAYQVHLTTDLTS